MAKYRYGVRYNRSKLTSGFIKNEIWNVVKPIVPYDTGFLLSNVRLGSNGMDIWIKYDPDNNVPYLDYLEEGTLRSTTHVGFIEDKTFNAIVTWLEKNQNRI